MRKQKIMKTIIVIRLIPVLVFGLGLNACTGLPKDVNPVQGFELNKYLGKWYEIARLDHSFERGLDKVSAEYSMREDGGVRVINRGYSIEDNDWQEAEGKAYFVRSNTEGYFKVSFFGPFYGSYIIFDLDKENYQYSFVSGNSTSYLWLLARTPEVDKTVLEQFISKAEQLGFETDKLIFPNQK